MKTYIFYTDDGFTKDNEYNDVDNCQILGWATGNNYLLALEELKKEVDISIWKNIFCQEVKNNKVYNI